MAYFIDDARNLNFTEVPNYAKLREYLHSMMRKKNLKLDYQFDWIKDT